MDDLNGYKIAQIGGLVLAFVMVILAINGTYSLALYTTYCILMLVGVGITYGAQARRCGTRPQARRGSPQAQTGERIPGRMTPIIGHQLVKERLHA